MFLPDQSTSALSDSIQHQLDMLVNATDSTMQLEILEQLDEKDQLSIAAVATSIIELARLTGRLTHAHTYGSIRRRFPPAKVQAASGLLGESRLTEIVSEITRTADSLVAQQQDLKAQGRGTLKKLAVYFSDTARQAQLTHPWEEVEPLYLISIGLWRQLGDCYNEAVVWNNLSSACLRNNRLDRVVAYSTHAEKLAGQYATPADGAPLDQLFTALMNQSTAPQLITSCKSNRAAALILQGRSEDAIEPLGDGCAFWQSIGDETHLRIDRVNLVIAYHNAYRHASRDGVLRELLIADGYNEDAIRALQKRTATGRDTYAESDLLEACVEHGLFSVGETDAAAKLRTLLLKRGPQDPEVQTLAAQLLETFTITGELDFHDREITLANRIAYVLGTTLHPLYRKSLAVLAEVILKQLATRAHPMSRENFIVVHRTAIDNLLEGLIRLADLTGLFDAVEAIAGRSLTDLCLRVEEGEWPPRAPISLTTLANELNANPEVAIIWILPLITTLRILCLTVGTTGPQLVLLPPANLGWVEVHDIMFASGPRMEAFLNAYARSRFLNSWKARRTDPFFPDPGGIFWFGAEQDCESFQKAVKAGEVSEQEVTRAVSEALKMLVNDAPDQSIGLFAAVSLRDALASFENVSVDTLTSASALIEAAWSQAAARLGAAIGAPLYGHLQHKGIRELVLVTPGRSGLIPYGGLPVSADSTPEYLLDHFIITGAPSATAWQHLRHRRRSRVSKPTALLSVADPNEDLGFASLQGELTSALCPDGIERSHLWQRDATLGALDFVIQNKTFIEFACHGTLAGSPNGHALYLARGEYLPLNELTWACNLSACDLVVVAACDSGRSQEKPESFSETSLADGFLAAGALGATGMLWPIRDIEATLLSIHLWHLVICENARPQDALRRSQLFLRNLTAVEASTLFSAAAANARLSKAAREQAELTARALKHYNPTTKLFASPLSWAAARYRGA